MDPKVLHRVGGKIVHALSDLTHPITKEMLIQYIGCSNFNGQDADNYIEESLRQGVRLGFIEKEHYRVIKEIVEPCTSSEEEEDEDEDEEEESDSGDSHDDDEPKSSVQLRKRILTSMHAIKSKRTRSRSVRGKRQSESTWSLPSVIDVESCEECRQRRKDRRSRRR